MQYDEACRGSGVDGIELYRWNSAVGLALFEDVGVVEVAMRSAIARELAACYGWRWYERRDVLDDESMRIIAGAQRVGRLSDTAASRTLIHDGIVARLMFGFWVKLLGRGSFAGTGPTRERRVYDTLLWKAAVRKAFPNADELGRAQVEATARGVQPSVTGSPTTVTSSGGCRSPAHGTVTGDPSAGRSPRPTRPCCALAAIWTPTSKRGCESTAECHTSWPAAHCPTRPRCFSRRP